MKLENEAVGLDLDGVVYDLITDLDEWILEKKISERINLERYLLTERYNLPKKDELKILNEYNQKRPFSRIKPFPRAIEAVKILARRTNLYIISKRDWAENGKIDTELSLQKYGLPIDKLYLTGEKGKLAKLFGIKKFFEDSGENAMDIIEKSPTTQVILIDKTYNQKYNHKRIIRVKSLFEGVNLFYKEIKRK